MPNAKSASRRVHGAHVHGAQVPDTKLTPVHMLSARENKQTLWHGCRYHYSYNTGLQAQGVLYSQVGLQDESRVLLDPNKLSDDGTVAPTTVAC